MDAPPPLDFERVLRVLEEHKVRYVVVGGGAASLHGAARATIDTDCVVLRTPENLDRVGRALRDLGAFLRVAGLSDEEARALPVRTTATALDNMGTTTWRTAAGDLDVMVDMPDRTGRRLNYEQLVPRARRIGTGSFVVRVAALDDIIASKEFAGRPKDLEALPELRALAAGAKRRRGRSL